MIWMPLWSSGSGKDGRITKSDVMSFLKTDESSNVTPGDLTPTSETTWRNWFAAN